MNEPTPSATDVRIPWRMAAACACGLALLFGVQNWITPGALRGNVSLGASLALQLMTWFLWLAMLPLVIRVARKARAAPRVTVSLVARQIVSSVGVAMLYGFCNGVLRVVLRLAVQPDPLDVLGTTMISLFASNVFRFWMISAAYHAVAYHREVREREASGARLQVSLARARLESLEGRLHPHFLFNTLNAIAALIREDPPAAERMVADLSELLRAALGAEPGREVTLARELELLGRYVAIQQARFQDRLRVSVEADHETLRAVVPHLVLQPLVENAIRHGIAPRESGGAVWVRARRDGDVLRLLVQDDGVGYGRAPASQGSGFGLSGTRARLAHLYGERGVLRVDGDLPNGTLVTVELPFHTSATREADAPAEAVPACA